MLTDAIAVKRRQENGLVVKKLEQREQEESLRLKLDIIEENRVRLLREKDKNA